MVWTKLSDDFGDDCWTLSDAAFRLHVEGLGFSNRKLLDCRLSKADVRRFAKCPEAAGELLSAGWWSDAGDYYVIRHHAGYQRPRELVIAQQEANKANGRRGGRPAKRKPASKDPGSREHDENTADTVAPPLTAETQSVSDSVSDSSTERDGYGYGTELLDERNSTTGEEQADEQFIPRSA